MDSIDDELPPDRLHSWRLAQALPGARLRNEIACGLYAQLPIRNESIEQADVPGVAYALVTRLVQSFRIEWTQPAEPVRDTEWSLDAFTWRAD